MNLEKNLADLKSIGCDPGPLDRATTRIPGALRRARFARQTRKPQALLWVSPALSN